MLKGSTKGTRKYKAKLAAAGIVQPTLARVFYRLHANVTYAEATRRWKVMTKEQQQPFEDMFQADCVRFNREKAAHGGFKKGKAGKTKRPPPREKKMYRSFSTAPHAYRERPEVTYLTPAKIVEIITKHDSRRVDPSSVRYKAFTLLFGSSHQLYDYRGWVTKMREDTVRHPELNADFPCRMTHVVLEYVKFSDFSGPHQQYDVSLGGSHEHYFIADEKMGKGHQATNSHYSGSNFCRAHLAVWENWTRDEEIAGLSNNLCNVSPTLSLVNASKLKGVETLFQTEILEEGHGIIITGTIYERADKEFQWLTCEDDDPIPVPTALGKVLIKRTENGVRAKGYKIHNTTGGLVKTMERVDVFKLLKMVGLPLTCSPNLFKSTLDGRDNPNYRDNPELLPFTPQIQAYRNAFGPPPTKGKEESPTTSSSGSSADKRRKVEVIDVSSGSETDFDPTSLED